MVERLEVRRLLSTQDIEGVVYLDADGDGVRGASEATLADQRVYLDDNDNGLLDWSDADGDDAWDLGEGERWVETGLDGRYRFVDPTAGAYAVRVDVPTPFVQTSPATDTQPSSSVDRTLTFDSILGSSTVIGYTEQGFAIGGFRPFDSSESGLRPTAGPTGTALEARLAPSDVILARTDGGAFDLTGIDLRATVPSFATVLRLTGVRADGSNVTWDADLASTNGTFTSFTVTGLDDVVEVRWSRAGFEDYHEFDNIDVTATPLPAGRVEVQSGSDSVGVDFGLNNP
ncbi:MAG: hypothetical protein AAF743_14715, partial [Planctomycetota bacterium]